MSKQLSILEFKKIAKEASRIGASKREYKQSDVGRIVTVIRELGYRIEKD